jgi:hypothetical protein
MTAAATEPKQDVVNTIQSGGFGRRFYFGAYFRRKWKSREELAAWPEKAEPSGWTLLRSFFRSQCGYPTAPGRD